MPTNVFSAVARCTILQDRRLNLVWGWGLEHGGDFGHSSDHPPGQSVDTSLRWPSESVAPVDTETTPSCFRPICSAFRGTVVTPAACEGRSMPHIHRYINSQCNVLYKGRTSDLTRKTTGVVPFFFQQVAHGWKDDLHVQHDAGALPYVARSICNINLIVVYIEEIMRKNFIVAWREKLGLT